MKKLNLLLLIIPLILSLSSCSKVKDMLDFGNFDVQTFIENNISRDYSLGQRENVAKLDTMNHLNVVTYGGGLVVLTDSLNGKKGPEDALAVYSIKHHKLLMDYIKNIKSIECFSEPITYFHDIIDSLDYYIINYYDDTCEVRDEYDNVIIKRGKNKNFLFDHINITKKESPKPVRVDARYYYNDSDGNLIDKVVEFDNLNFKNPKEGFFVDRTTNTEYKDYIWESEELSYINLPGYYVSGSESILKLINPDREVLYSSFDFLVLSSRYFRSDLDKNLFLDKCIVGRWDKGLDQAARINLLDGSVTLIDINPNLVAVRACQYKNNYFDHLITHDLELDKYYLMNKDFEVVSELPEYLARNRIIKCDKNLYCDEAGKYLFDGKGKVIKKHGDKSATFQTFDRHFNVPVFKTDNDKYYFLTTENTNDFIYDPEFPFYVQSSNSQNLSYGSKIETGLYVPCYVYSSETIVQIDLGYKSFYLKENVFKNEDYISSSYGFAEFENRDDETASIAVYYKENDGTTSIDIISCYDNNNPKFDFK